MKTVPLETPLNISSPYASIPEAIADVARGKPIIVVDDEDRENEGDIVVAAEFASTENLTFMAKQAGGLVCLAIEPALAEKLELSFQPQRHLNENQARFTVSIEAREGVTTGISAPDRAHTIATAISESATADDIATPGHVFPLVADRGGLSARQGHTESSIAFAKLAGCHPSAVICEILNDDGEMARGERLFSFARTHDIKVARIDDLIAYIKEQG